jgi:hypothetical protein
LNSISIATPVEKRRRSRWEPFTITYSDRNPLRQTAKAALVFNSIFSHRRWKRLDCQNRKLGCATRVVCHVKAVMNLCSNQNAIVAKICIPCSAQRGSQTLCRQSNYLLIVAFEFDCSFSRIGGSARSEVVVAIALQNPFVSESYVVLHVSFFVICASKATVEVPDLAQQEAKCSRMLMSLL